MLDDCSAGFLRNLCCCYYELGGLELILFEFENKNSVDDEDDKLWRIE